MAEDWAAAARDIASGLAEAGFDVIVEEPGVRSGPPSNPSFGDPVQHRLKATDKNYRIKDSGGVITNQIMRTLMAEAGKVVPQKGWRVQVRGEWLTIGVVRPYAPGGVDLYYHLDLEMTGGS